MEGNITWSQVLLYLGSCLFTIVAVTVGGISVYLMHVYRTFAHIPQPTRESFFFGHGINIKNKIASGILFGELMRQYFLELGHTFVLIILGRPLVLTADQDAIKHILVTGDYPKSRKEYASIAYIFGQRQLKLLMADFNQVSNDLMDRLADKADGKMVITMMESLNRVTLDVIGKVAFGMDINSLNDPSSPFPAAIFKSLQGFSDTGKSIVSHKIPFMKMKFKKEVREAIQLLRDTGSTVIEQRHKDAAKGVYLPTDVISYVIDAQKKDPTITNDEILDDFVTFFVAGQETTANALGFTILELGRHPEVLKRLQEEIDNVVGERHEVTFEDISKLEFMNMVIKESLRMYPPAQITFRETPEDRTIAGYPIPTGTTIAISQYATARLDEFTPDALVFDPDRFHPDSKRKPATYANFPFSLGPRNCVGMVFAQIEAKLILTKFLQRFRFRLDPDQSMGIEENTTLRPKDGTRVILTQRDM